MCRHGSEQHTKALRRGLEVRAMVLSSSGLNEEVQMKGCICLAGDDSKNTAGNYLGLAFKA